MPLKLIILAKLIVKFVPSLFPPFLHYVIISMYSQHYFPVLPSPPERSVEISSSSSTIKYLVKIPCAILSPI